MNIFSRITARTMAQNRTRTVVTVIGIILSTAMITAVAALGSSFHRFLLETNLEQYGNWHVNFFGLSDQRMEEIEKSGEVRASAVVKEIGCGSLGFSREAGEERPVLLYVKELSKEAQEMLPIELTEGRLPENGEEAVVSRLAVIEAKNAGRTIEVGKELSLELGSRTAADGTTLHSWVMYQGGEGEEGENFSPGQSRTYRVVGIFDTWADDSFWPEALTGPSQEGASCEELFLRLVRPRDVYDFAEWALSGQGGVVSSYNIAVLRWLGAADNDNYLSILIRLLTVLILVIMAGSVTLIYNAFSISLRERTAQFGLLASVGATKRQLRAAMRYEALFVCAIGIPLGILAGVAGTAVTLRFIGAGIGNLIYGMRKGVRLYVPFWAICAAAAVAFFTVLISVWIPSRRIRKITPMDAIRSTADIRIRPREVRTRGWVESLFGIPGMLAQKNYRRDRRKYRATVVSLTMSIVLFATAALFNRYLMSTGTFIMEVPDTDLEYTIYEDGREQEQRSDRVLAQTEGITWLEKFYSAFYTMAVPENWGKQSPVLENYTQAVLDESEGTIAVNVRVLALEEETFARLAREAKADPDEIETADSPRFLYLESMPVYNGTTQRYEKEIVYPEAEGQFDLGVLTEEETEDGVRPYFEKKLEAELAAPVEELPGSVKEYGGMPVLILSLGQYERFFGMDEENLSVHYGIRCENPGETYEELESTLGEAGSLRNLAEQYELDQSTLTAIRVLTYGFIALIGLIAVANVFNTISTNLLLRRKEFAMLRSMGMPPGGFRRMMNYECLIYGLRAVAYGVILTLLLSVEIRRILGSGVDTALVIPWGYLAAAVIGVFVVVFLTMLYTMHRLERGNIVEELMIT